MLSLFFVLVRGLHVILRVLHFKLLVKDASKRHILVACLGRVVFVLSLILLTFAIHFSSFIQKLIVLSFKEAKLILVVFLFYSTFSHCVLLVCLEKHCSFVLTVRSNSLPGRLTLTEKFPLCAPAPIPPRFIILEFTTKTWLFAVLVLYLHFSLALYTSCNQMIIYLIEKLEVANQFKCLAVVVVFSIEIVMIFQQNLVASVTSLFVLHAEFKCMDLCTHFPSPLCLPANSDINQFYCPCCIFSCSNTICCM